MGRLTNLLLLAGVVSFIAGCSILAVWFGLIVAGVLSVSLALAMDRASETGDKKPQPPIDNRRYFWKN